MIDNDIKRLSRLTAILMHLQSKRLITSTMLSEKFNVSVRTIYRDIKALEQAGVPVITEEGKGYRLMEGYRIPPIMFTESEANALITAEKLILKSKDTSFIQEYCHAILKVKAVLDDSTREKAHLLSERTLVRPQLQHIETSNNMIAIQNALTEFKVLKLTYQSVNNGEITTRFIEPFALYHNSQENWNLIAWCRLRNDFRQFRLDGIKEILATGKTFAPHKLTLEEYVDIQRNKYLYP